MFANHPEMAKRWAAHTPEGVKLPEHVADDKIKDSKPMTSKNATEHTDKTQDHPDRPGVLSRALSSVPIVGDLHTYFNSPEGHGPNRLVAQSKGQFLGANLGALAGGALGYGLGGADAAIPVAVLSAVGGRAFGGGSMLRAYDDHHFPKGVPGTPAAAGAPDDVLGGALGDRDAVVKQKLHSLLGGALGDRDAVVKQKLHSLLGADQTKQATEHTDKTQDHPDRPSSLSRAISSIPGIGGIHSLVASPEGHAVGRTGNNMLGGLIGTVGGSIVGDLLGVNPDATAALGNMYMSHRALSKYDNFHFPKGVPGIQSEPGPSADARSLAHVTPEQWAAIYQTPELQALAKKYNGDWGHPVVDAGAIGMAVDRHGYEAKQASATKIPGFDAKLFPGGTQQPVHGSAPVNMARAKIAGLNPAALRKTAGLGSTMMGLAKKVPVAGTVLGGLGGAMQAHANGEGVTGMVGRGLLGAAAGTVTSVPGVGTALGAADIAGMGPGSAANAIGNKLFQPKQPPAPSMLPAGPRPTV
jgi:hypothetical protein